MLIELRKVKRGDYFKLAADSNPVFVRGEYVRGKRGFWPPTFSCSYFDDVNRERFLRPDRMVEVGFTF